MGRNLVSSLTAWVQGPPTSPQRQTGERGWTLRRWLSLVGAGSLVLVASCSGTPAANHLSVTPPVPSGWKTVTYHGVGIDVPGDWTVEPRRPNCGTTTPTVFVGPEGIGVLFCPEFMTGAAEVILGARNFGKRPVVPETLNGLHASERTHQPSITATFRERSRPSS